MTHLLHHLLREAARGSPDAEAVRCAGRSLSYAQLEADSNGLAAALIGAGVEPGDRIGIQLPKCVEMVAAVFGALKTGGAYVPLDPHAPVPRVAAVASDCSIAALVTTPDRAAALLPSLHHRPRLVIVVQDVDGVPQEMEGSAPAFADLMVTYAAATEDPNAPDPLISVSDTDLAYILYTSGSTGMPKGVMLTHRNALTFIEWCAERIGVRPGDRLSNHAPLHFDLSTFDLFLAAFGRATVVPVPDEQAFFGAALARFVREEAITTWYSVPSALVLMMKALPGVNALPELRTIVFAGEVFPTKHLRELKRLLPDAVLWNLYGPTETNVCTYHRVDRVPDDDRSIPIGRACENIEVFAVTDDGAIADVGEEGELYVRGSSVMTGYWGRPDITEHVLVPDPLEQPTGERVYKTGDLVRLRSDGDYDFLGRRDHQIKSRGYRIELGDVEVALNSHPSIVQAVALGVPHDGLGTAIVACVALREGASLSPRDVRVHVGSQLPRYMVPSEVRIVPELPRTSTGKVDRGRLRDELLQSDPSARAVLPAITG